MPLSTRPAPPPGPCITPLNDMDEPIATTLPVLTEAFHLLGPAGDGGAALMDFIARGGLKVIFSDENALVRAFELMVQSADAPMDFADASLVTAAETHSLQTIFTLDRGDFNTCRIRRGHRHVAFDIIG
ncbi:MAG: hypothetical protein OXE42_08240 [Gammaproteobacteria bacterium]|nr:hypothetical protein [Gammaproteobacteria bacterium]